MASLDVRLAVANLLFGADLSGVFSVSDSTGQPIVGLPQTAIAIEVRVGSTLLPLPDHFLVNYGFHGTPLSSPKRVPLLTITELSAGFYAFKWSLSGQGTWSYPTLVTLAVEQGSDRGAAVAAPDVG